MHTEKIDFETRQNIKNKIMFRIMEGNWNNVPLKIYPEISCIVDEVLEEVNNEKS